MPPKGWAFSKRLRTGKVLVATLNLVSRRGSVIVGDTSLVTLMSSEFCQTKVIEPVNPGPPPQIFFGDIVVFLSSFGVNLRCGHRPANTA